MPKKIFLTLLFLLSVSLFASITLKDIQGAQRWPWNGLVDNPDTVAYAQVDENGPRLNVDVSFRTFDDRQQTVPIPPLTGDGVNGPLKSAGTYTTAWNSSADSGDHAVDSLSITVPGSIAYPTYMVVDLSGGPNAASYPVRYTNNAPDISKDDCRTTELWLRRIPAGTFMMGSPEDELWRNSDETLHQVTLTRDFYIGVFEVTQRQWELVMGNNPSYYKGDCRPVDWVSYKKIRGGGWPSGGYQADSGTFMGKLQAKTGLMIDLPTESQWEYACRKRADGTCWTTALNSGKDLTDLSQCPNMAEVGRYWHNSFSNGTAKVGSYLPGELGLYDMHGNVREWCLDWYGDYPRETEDPKGKESGSCRVIRGGSWINVAADCRAALRGSVFYPSDCDNCSGFRAACLTDDQSGPQKPEWEYSLNGNGNASITAYNGTSANVVIPSELDGHPVTAINTGAFGDNEDIISITVPTRITLPEEDIFASFKNLMTVTRILEDDSYDITLYNSVEGADYQNAFITIKSYAGKRALTDCIFDNCEIVIQYSSNGKEHVVVRTSEMLDTVVISTENLLCPAVECCDQAQISGCHFENNRNTGGNLDGGAIFSDNEGIKISDTDFKGNFANVDDDVISYFHEVYPNVANCIIAADGAGGAITLSNDDDCDIELENCRFLTPTDTIFSQGILTISGTVQFAGNIFFWQEEDSQPELCNKGTVVFDLKPRNAANGILLNDGRYITGSGNWQISVSNNQPLGSYGLIDYANDFSKQIDLLDENGQKLGTLTIGGNPIQDSVSGRSYALRKTNGLLSLEVSTFESDTLMSISISGSETIASGKTSSYTCTATWKSGKTLTVKPTWKLSSTQYASVNTGGKVTNKNTTALTRQVTLTATYEGKSAQMRIALNAAQAIWEYSLDDNGDASITAYNGTSANVVIPSELDGHPVTAIAAGAFEKNSIITSVTLPVGIKMPAENPFAGCTKLTTVNYTLDGVRTDFGQDVKVNVAGISATETTITLNPGWNLITLPQGELTSDSLNALQALESIFFFDAQQRVFLKAVEFEAGRPYWIFTTETIVINTK